jgi:hypothetical protein
VVTATAKFVQLRDSFGELTSHQYYSLVFNGSERRDIRQVVANLDPLRSIAAPSLSKARTSVKHGCALPTQERSRGVWIEGESKTQ